MGIYALWLIAFVLIILLKASTALGIFRNYFGEKVKGLDQVIFKTLFAILFVKTLFDSFYAIQVHVSSSSTLRFTHLPLPFSGNSKPEVMLLWYFLLWST